MDGGGFVIQRYIDVFEEGKIVAVSQRNGRFSGELFATGGGSLGKVGEYCDKHEAKRL